MALWHAPRHTKTHTQTHSFRAAALIQNASSCRNYVTLFRGCGGGVGSDGDGALSHQLWTVWLGCRNAATEKCYHTAPARPVFGVCRHAAVSVVYCWAQRCFPCGACALCDSFVIMIIIVFSTQANTQHVAVSRPQTTNVDDDNDDDTLNDSSSTKIQTPEAHKSHALCTHNKTCVCY